MEEKKLLRQYIRNEKKKYSRQELEAWSEQACSLLLSHPAIVNANIVLLYWSLADEVTTHHLVQRLTEKGKAVVLPKVVSDTTMTLHLFTSLDDMCEGAYGIMEPVGNEVSIGQLQAEGKELVAVVPGMAFDSAGHRLGRGKGYYDRLLEKLPHAVKIGLCYKFQLLPEVKAEPWDIVMNEVMAV